MNDLTVAEVMHAVGESDLPLEVVAYLAPILQSIVEPDSEQAARIKDVVAQFGAGLEGLRNELNMPWELVNRKRIDALANQIADFAADWSVYDSYLIGTFLAASARMQLRQANPDAGPDLLEQAQSMVGIAASANEQLKAELDEAGKLLEAADKIGVLAQQAIASRVPPEAVIREALAFKRLRADKAAGF